MGEVPDPGSSDSETTITECTVGASNNEHRSIRLSGKCGILYSCGSLRTYLRTPCGRDMHASYRGLSYKSALGVWSMCVRLFELQNV